MVTVKIGRDPSCQILLDHEMISRHHAILRIYPTGKMELVSMGANGTKLNGALMRPNVVYRVKRSDMVSFADRFQLDWNLIYNPTKKYRIAVLCILGLIALLGAIKAGVMIYDYFNPFEEIEIPMENSVKLQEPLHSNQNNVLNIDTNIVNVQTTSKANPKSISSRDFFIVKPTPKTMPKEAPKDSIKSDSLNLGKKATESVEEPTDSTNIRNKIII